MALRMLLRGAVVRSPTSLPRLASTAPTATALRPLVSPEEAVADIHPGATLLVGGFGLCGIPENLIAAIQRHRIGNLTLVSDNGGAENIGPGALLHAGLVRRMISSYLGGNKEFERMYLSGEIEVELVPQGTLAERLRCGGAGIPAFFTPTGFGTIVQTGGSVVKYGPSGEKLEVSPARETRKIKGHDCVLEESINGDFALIKAWKGDKAGNLIFHKAARNFNVPMAKAAKVTIAEVEEIVEVGELDPNHIHLPGVYVDRLVHCDIIRRRIQVPRFASDEADAEPLDPVRERIARRTALEFQHGMYVNLGVGIPTLSGNFIPQGIAVTLQSENGFLGLGPFPHHGEEDADLVNAGKETVTILPHGSFFSSDESFAMIRGGHLNMTVLGAMQVSAKGDLANWLVPGHLARGMGGAMDLVSSATTRVVVTTQHCTKHGDPKVVQECAYPLTGKGVVDRIITEKAVFDVTPEGLVLLEIDPTLTIKQLEECTDATFIVSPSLCDYRQSDA
eukprot:m.132889 g.132889  ORF g.132889 m.132889 type:complete len:507 (+) comp9841_c0_seq2:98-1618(+)